ncbi:hypothetical protein C1752_00658 [Acaryochloris thomasi RCC1774]|uniref:Uncharacterized protein n=1 Tax=Acaryochloris thomasi RCC1774 TaxID=1764569 RepID=A0A2W1K4P1_9CYAN|nr:hypothetical protein [Acaryochloris thomasi]PZD74951.1 hypothetical protein C1752_00658 [Acaryochloris thomasi RCC1774]
MQERELAAFQDHLLETLFTSSDGETVLEQLQDSSVPQPMIDYIETFDPRMVEVAAELLKKWGQRS